MKRMPRTAILAVVLLAVATLTACSPTVAMEPAAQATDPGCAQVIVHLPESVADQPQRETNAQATSAWGEPASVLLRCGVTPPGPSEEICFTVKGIDWLRDQSKAPRYVFTTYGRTPAVQVVIDTELTEGQGTIILDELANAVGLNEQTRQCTNQEDVLGSTGLTPTATPAP